MLVIDKNIGKTLAVRIAASRLQRQTVPSVSCAYLHKRLHAACFVERDDGIRVISFRKANNLRIAKQSRRHTPSL